MLSLTQGKFSALFGVSRDNIASYERGTKPKMDFIARVVDYFHITYDDFIGSALDERSLPAVGYYLDDPGVSQVNEPEAGYCPGEGKEEERAPGWQNIPIYDLGPSDSLSSLFGEPQAYQPVDYLAASSLPRCDGGIRVSGDGMAPVVKSGDVVLYKQVHDIRQGTLWGEMYLLSFEVDGEEYVLVKYLHESPNPECVRLVSHNPDYAPKEISFSQIKALALVKMSIRVNSLR